MNLTKLIQPNSRFMSCIIKTTSGMKFTHAEHFQMQNVHRLICSKGINQPCEFGESYINLFFSLPNGKNNRAACHAAVMSHPPGENIYPPLLSYFTLNFQLSAIYISDLKRAPERCKVKMTS